MQTWGGAGGTARTLVMFPLRPGVAPAFKLLLVEIPGDTGKLVPHLRGPAPALRLFLRDGSSDDPTKDVLLGTVTMVYAPEK